MAGMRAMDAGTRLRGGADLSTASSQKPPLRNQELQNPIRRLVSAIRQRVQGTLMPFSQSHSKMTGWIERRRAAFA